MCGRYQIVTDAQALYDAFQVEAELDAAPLPGSGGGRAACVTPGLPQGRWQRLEWRHADESSVTDQA